MNTLIQESIKYAANTNTHKYESIQDALADAYAHGRLAKPCEEEIQAVVQYLKDSAGNFGLKGISSYRLRATAKGMLKTARRAITPTAVENKQEDTK